MKSCFLYNSLSFSFLQFRLLVNLEPTIWYPEPRFASMGKSTTSVTVADVTEDEMDREFQQHQILTQLQEFQESLSMMIVRNEDLQQAIADLSVHRIRQDQVQQTILDEIRVLKTLTQPSLQILIGSIPISLGPTPFSAVHTPIPPPTWGLSSSQHLTFITPLGSHFAMGPSSISFTPSLTSPLPSLSQPSTSRYLPSPSTGPTLSFFNPDLPGPCPYLPPSPPFSASKTLKINPPHFSKDDPYGWLAMAEEFLDYHEIAEHHHITVESLHLIGDAAHWLHWFKTRFLLSSWATFIAQLLQRFGPADSLNFNMALSHIS